jgi:hypothetical protein
MAMRNGLALAALALWGTGCADINIQFGPTITMPMLEQAGAQEQAQPDVQLTIQAGQIASQVALMAIQIAAL